jgi:hypothetical protein
MGYSKIRVIISDILKEYECNLVFANCYDKTCSELMTLVSAIISKLVGGQVLEAFMYFFSFHEEGKILWEEIKSRMLGW